MGAKRKKLEKIQKPLFGKVAKLTGSISSLEGKWHVEFYDIDYYFLGVEIFSRALEKVVFDKETA